MITSEIQRAVDEAVERATGTARPDRFITRDELRQLVPYSDMHLWRLERDGKFPKRVKIGAKRVGWIEKEIRDWMAARAAARTPPQAA